MSRHQIITDLLRANYPLVTPALIENMKAFRALNKGKANVDELMLDEIWKTSDRRFKVGVLSQTEDSPSQLKARLAAGVNPESRAKLSDYLSRAQDYEDTLNDMDDVTLLQLHDESDAVREREKIQRRAQKGGQADVLAFFNRGKAAADLKFWSKKPHWTAEEAAALSLGKDPRVVNVSTLGEYTHLHGSPFRDSFIDRLDAIERAVTVKQLVQPITLTNFKKWASLHQIGVFPEILADLGSGRSVKEIGVHANHLHSCYLIILGLAIKHYGYNPLIPLPDKQTKAVKKLGEDLESVWADINARTLSKILENAANLENQLNQVLSASGDWARVSENKVVKRPGLKRPDAPIK